MKKEKEVLFLIDGNSYCYRAYYAIKELKTSEGFPTNAVYGFFNMLNKIIEEEKPNYMAVSFDTKAPTFRHKEYKEYKGHRKPMPEDLVVQLPWIKKILSVLGINIYEAAGYEADDVIATLAKRFNNGQIKIYIASSDKDILQLVDSNLHVYKYQNGIRLILKKEQVRQKYQIDPAEMIDFLALMGDSSDNIPGIPGVGAKTAAKLINQYGGVEEILSNTNNIKPESLRKKVEDNKDLALLSKKLTRLDADVDIKVELSDLKFSIKEEGLISIFKTLEFDRLIEKIRV